MLSEEEKTMDDMKRCYKCKETLPRSEFYKNRAQHDGLQGTCKPCSKAVTKAWQDAHPARVAAYALAREERYALHPEDRPIPTKEWREAHPGRVAAYVAWHDRVVVKRKAQGDDGTMYKRQDTSSAAQSAKYAAAYTPCAERLAAEEVDRAEFEGKPFVPNPRFVRAHRCNEDYGLIYMDPAALERLVDGRY